MKLEKNKTNKQTGISADRINSYMAQNCRSEKMQHRADLFSSSAFPTRTTVIDANNKIIDYTGLAIEDQPYLVPIILSVDTPDTDSREAKWNRIKRQRVGGDA